MLIFNVKFEKCVTPIGGFRLAAVRTGLNCTKTKLHKNKIAQVHKLHVCTGVKKYKKKKKTKR